MKLETVQIDNYRAIEQLRLPLDPDLTVLHGGNTCGKTSVLNAVAVGLGAIPDLLPGVSGIDFLHTDLRTGESAVQVDLTAADGLSWRRERVYGSPDETPKTVLRGLNPLKGTLLRSVRADREAQPPVDLPVVAYYDTDRAVLDVPESWRGSGDVPPYPTRADDGTAAAAVDRWDFPRCAALDGALAARAKYSRLLQWFRAKEDEELREQRKRRDFDFRRRDLSAVRRAISSMLDSVSEPRIEVRPLRFLVTARLDGGHSDTLEIDQLSDGQRAVLALAADLARRMAQANPHLDDPLASEAVVLIDEVELHLHPSWQQRILTDLRRTFPNTQFIVSTHSPQVLTTVEPRHVVQLAREDGRIVAGSAAGWTYGAEAGDVLAAVMGVDQRPDNRFTQVLARYRRLVGDDLGESEEALALRRELNAMSADDPALDRADIEIRRRKRFRELGRST